MPITLDISNDWRVVDNTESVMYEVRTGPGNDYAAPVLIENCLRQERAVTQQMGGDSVVVDEIWLTIWKDNIPEGSNIVPKYGDRFTMVADSTQWICVPIDKDSSWRTRYRMAAKRSQWTTR